MKELLEVKNLSFSYQQKVVSDVSMTLHRQEIVGLIGQNGCGKSTLLKGIIGGLVSTQGQVYVSGQDYFAMNIKMRAQNIAMMTQRCEVIEGFTVSEMIELGGYLLVFLIHILMKNGLCKLLKSFKLLIY